MYHCFEKPGKGDKDASQVHIVKLNQSLVAHQGDLCVAISHGLHGTLAYKLGTTHKNIDHPEDKLCPHVAQTRAPCSRVFFAEQEYDENKHRHYLIRMANSFFCVSSLQLQVMDKKIERRFLSQKIGSRRTLLFYLRERTHDALGHGLPCP